MKLWLTTTENKCFVKMLWHLLGECVKVTVLLVYSICTFFFQSSICALFSLIYKIANACTMILHGTSTMPFYWVTLSLFYFLFLVLNSSYSTKQYCSYIFFFSKSSVCTFFFPFIYIYIYIYILYWHNKFHNIFTIIKVSIFYKSK